MIIKIIILMILVSVATYTDIKENKIKNKHLCLFLILGLILSIIYGGIDGIKDSILGIIVPFVLLFLFFAFRMFGAGDIKLYCTIGSIMGLKFILNNIIYSFLLAGVIIILKLIFSKKLFKVLKGIYLYFANMFLSKNIFEFESTVGEKFPFAIAISVGTIVQLVVGYNFI